MVSKVIIDKAAIRAFQHLGRIGKRVKDATEYGGRVFPALEKTLGSVDDAAGTANDIRNIRRCLNRNSLVNSKGGRFH